MESSPGDGELAETVPQPAEEDLIEDELSGLLEDDKAAEGDYELGSSAAEDDKGNKKKKDKNR